MIRTTRPVSGRLLAAATTAVLVLGACGGDDSSGSDSAPSTSSTVPGQVTVPGGGVPVTDASGVTVTVPGGSPATAPPTTAAPGSPGATTPAAGNTTTTASVSKGSPADIAKAMTFTTVLSDLPGGYAEQSSSGSANNSALGEDTIKKCVAAAGGTYIEPKATAVGKDFASPTQVRAGSIGAIYNSAAEAKAMFDVESTPAFDECVKQAAKEAAAKMGLQNAQVSLSRSTIAGLAGVEQHAVINMTITGTFNATPITAYVSVASMRNGGSQVAAAFFALGTPISAGDVESTAKKMAPRLKA